MSCQARSIVASAPAYSAAYSAAAPAYSAAYSVAAPARSIVAAAPAYSVVAAPAAIAVNRWADYSPNPVQLALPALPAPDYRCYQAPPVAPGQTRFQNLQEPTAVKNLEQNFNDQRTAVRENNLHVQRNKTNITNINRNHNHLLRIVTNENNHEHNLVNNIVRVADIHRQRIENVAGQRRNFKDFKQTQKVENLGCRREGAAQVAYAAPALRAAPALSYVSAAAPLAPAAYSGAGAPTIRTVRGY